MPVRTWGFDPGSGGVRIPEPVKIETEKRLREYADEHFAGRFSRLDIRFKGQFCYVDAYTEPELSENWPPPYSPETREQMIERLRDTPTHLCRLRYFGHYYGENCWGFAFYTYSNERYELSVFPTGDFLGKPEEALEASSIYL